jgi:hypothetical protein
MGQVAKTINQVASQANLKATAFMKKIIDIYEVYFDLFVTNKTGRIVAAGVNQNLVGLDMSGRRWFREMIEKLGVFTTRFNWNYIYDIIDSVKIDKNSELYVINKDGIVIASRDRKGILEMDLSSLDAVKKLLTGQPYGYTIERDKFGKEKIFAFCRTKGYNAYKGKGWSVIVSESLN